LPNDPGVGSTLGLTAWAAGARDRRIALISVLALLVATAILTPVATRPLPESLPLVGMLLAAAIVASAIAGLLLLFQARALRSTPTVVLACGFFYAAATMVPYAVVYGGMFPGVDESLHISPGASGLLWFSWHLGLLVSMLAFGLLRRLDRTDPAVRRRARAFVLTTAVFFVVYTAFALWFDPLPAASIRGRLSPFIIDVMAPVVTVLSALVIATTIRRSERATVLDLWLAVVAFAMIVEAWLSVAGKTSFTLGWYASRAAVVVAIALLLGMLLRQAAKRYVALMARARVLEAEAHTDTLTGLPNRRRFDEEFARAFGSAVRRDSPLSVAIADIDRFKLYNDAFGHQAGDDALHKIGAVIAESVGRSNDFAARYGGEEFVVILEDTLLDGAAGVAERIRAAVLDARLTAPTGAPLSVSVGVASRRPNESAEDLLRHADEALYYAKDAGRNRVALWHTAGEAT
jgi:diguanylate cyclase (GGDEF)-like protein